MFHVKHLCTFSAQHIYVLFRPSAPGWRLQLQTRCVCNVLFGAKSTKNAGGSDSPHTPTNGPCGELSYRYYSPSTLNCALPFNIVCFADYNIISAARTGNYRHCRVYIYFFAPAQPGWRLQLQTRCVCNVLFGAKSTKNAGGSDSPHTPTNGPCGELSCRYCSSST